MHDSAMGLPFDTGRAGARPLEREDALAQLAEGITDARLGRGRLILVAGEVGIGKTSLVRWLTESVDGEIDVRVGACDPSGLFEDWNPRVTCVRAVGTSSASTTGAWGQGVGVPGGEGRRKAVPRLPGLGAGRPSPAPCPAAGARRLRGWA